MNDDETLEQKHKRLMDAHQELLIKIQETNVRIAMDLSMLSEELGRVNQQMQDKPEPTPPLKLVG